nr:Phosphoribosylanthranilate isomerase [Kibdelosporangium sp. MJ126-NF4]CTQ88553.1 Phosphoribosylanthranilate isomerase (EC 5.3.1.24) [Kibdelosporangium sp. MJ126-NF4]
MKVCGLRTQADVEVSVTAGADAVGFVFTKSARQVDAETVRGLIADVPDTVLTVGVFAGIPAAEAGRIAGEAGVGAVQLHGDYPAEAFKELLGGPFRLIRATALTEDTDVTVGAYGEDMLLLDSPVAGSGERWDLSVLAQSRPSGTWLLAGGLAPANVTTAIETARPWGVDVSSGVESSRGVKDHELIRSFVRTARAAA